MSYATPIGSPESDLQRRLRTAADAASLFETRMSFAEKSIADSQYYLGLHEQRLNDHQTTLASHANTLSSHANRLAELEALPFVVVRNAAEFLAALSRERYILVVGTIDLTDSPLVTNVPGHCKIWGVPGRSKIHRDHINGSGVNVLTITGPNVHLRDIEISTDHPLVTDNGRAVQDVGVYISNGPAVDWSGLIIEHCYIHHVSTPIRYWPGGAAATFAQDPVIRFNRLESFTQCGIELNWRMLRPKIHWNTVRGRVGSQSHVVGYNGIYVANQAEYASICWNFVDEVDRHGIELWNEVTGYNKNPMLVGNIMGRIGRYADPDVGAFGMSILANGTVDLYDNIVGESVAIGIETVVTPENIAEFNAHHNTVNRVMGIKAGLPTIGYSIDANAAHKKMSGRFDHNFCGYVGHTDSPTERFGMQVIGGTDFLLLEQNTFRNAGNRHIQVLGGSGTECVGLEIIGNRFIWTPDAPFWGYNPTVTLWGPTSPTVFQHNRVWVPTGATYGQMQAVTNAKVYTGGPATSPLITAGPVIDIDGATNLRIEY